jgi:hypothetical protein
VTTYAIEVRAAEDLRLLGHIDCEVPPREPGDYQRFAFRSSVNYGRSALRSSVKNLVMETVDLRVAEVRNGNHAWLAFSVPADQWEQIKDKVR